MSKNKIILFFIWSFFFLVLLTTFCYSANAAGTITVGGPNSGADYICNLSSAQGGINQAMQKAKSLGGATVVLKGSTTYTITDTITIYSNITFTGESGAKLKLGSGLKWAAFKPIIHGMNQSDITVHGFEIDGNFAGNPQYLHGKGYFNMMWFQNCNNIVVHHMHLHDSHGDGVRAKGGTGVRFYENKVERVGHDGLFCLNMYDIEFYNNRVIARANSACRTNNCNHVKIYNNYVTAGNLYSGPGFQIESHGTIKMNDIQIYNNNVVGVYCPGIWLIRADAVAGSTKNYGDSSYATGVRIYNNEFKDNGRHPTINWAGGIVINGWNNTVIQNNRFDGNLGSAVTFMGGYPGATKTLIEGNHFLNTKKHKASGGGYAVYNRNGKHEFIDGGGNVFINNGRDVVGGDIIKGAESVLEELRNIGSNIDWGDLSSGGGSSSWSGRSDPLRKKPKSDKPWDPNSEDLANWAKSTKELLENNTREFKKPNIKRLPNLIDAILKSEDPNYVFNDKFPDFPKIYDEESSGEAYRSPYDALMMTFDYLGKQAEQAKSNAVNKPENKQGDKQDKDDDGVKIIKKEDNKKDIHPVYPFDPNNFPPK